MAAWPGEVAAFDMTISVAGRRLVFAGRRSGR